MPSLYLGSRRIDYAVVRGNSRRYTYFRFRPDLTIEVILPRGRVVDVEKALRDRSVWLQHEYEKLSKIKDVLGNDTVMYDGKLLKVVFSQSPGDSLVPDLVKREVVVHTSERKRFRELVRRWFLKESSAYVVRMVAEMAPKLGVRPSRVDVREMGKWGYCTRSGRLSFSWQMIALPEKLREYVVLHELTHLREFNHSSAFKRRLAVFCPDFRAREKELSLVTPYNRLAPPG
ncbi:MAG TPA: YgjP-like metallopeptidase domain-containing protein [Nitrososphaerales archaeon]|nr:YgjP-like metallopeptidase domain-containing protein [Nitrososphaerales archaeon]